MSFQIKICLDNDEWDEFVVHSPQANIFCQTRFLEIYHDNYDLFFVKKNEFILMGVIILKGSKKSVIKNPFMYQGVLFSQYFASSSPSGIELKHGAHQLALISIINTFPV